MSKPAITIPYNTLMRYMYGHMQDMILATKPGTMSMGDRLLQADQSYKILEKQLQHHGIKLELTAEHWPFEQQIGDKN